MKRIGMECPAGFHPSLSAQGNEKMLVRNEALDELAGMDTRRLKLPVFPPPEFATPQPPTAVSATTFLEFPSKKRIHWRVEMDSDRRGSSEWRYWWRIWRCWGRRNRTAQARLPSWLYLRP
jgi:hypothetical protein